MKLLSVIFSFLTVSVTFSNGANILAIINGPSFSHYSLGTKLLLPLAKKGHHVTMAAPFTLKNPPKTWKDIEFKKFREQSDKDGHDIIFQMAKASSYVKETMFGIFGPKITTDFMNDPAFQTMLNLNETFDVIIMEKFMNDAFLGLAYHFKAPYILLSTMGYSRWINEMTGNPWSPAYLPDIQFDYTTDMNLWQRFHNTFFFCYAQLISYFYAFPKQQAILEQYFPGAPKLKDLYYNASLMFVNTHPAVKYASPSVPNMIEIGGYHIDPPKPLPDHLQKFMDSAPNGVIYFSLGSALKSKDIDVNIRNALLNSFSRLKQKVIWKYEANPDFEVPSNVKLEKWLPQQDLLAHPNLKLFITHGGLLSTIEAVYHGVPLLSIPVFAEQLMNAAETQGYGYGLYIPYIYFDQNKFDKLLNEMLTNSKYKENVVGRSKVFRDQDMKPEDKIVYWTEHVIRHKGAPHLRSVTLNLKWYQYYLLDVIILFLAILYIAYFLIKICIRKLLCRKKVRVEKNKKRN